MTSILLRNELLKTTRRPGARVVLGVFTAMLAIAFVETLTHALRNPGSTPFSFPRAWLEIAGDPAVPAAFCAAIVLILLVDSEFSWRTARQNVIDGLSKEQWFGGKLMLYVVLCLGFFFTQVLVGAAIAAWGTHVQGATGPFIRGTDMQLLGADLLCIGGLGALAFLVAFLTRSAGPSMAAFFFYLALERPLGAGLHRLGVSETVVRLMPMNLFTEVVRPERYDAEAYGRMVAELTKNHRPIPTMLGTHLLVAVGLAEIALFLALAFVVYQRRDL
jgi:ABC-2 type transport system permease protein